MAAKLVFALIAVVIIVCAVLGYAFWYFNQESERQHEKDIKQMEQTDRIMDAVEDDEL